MIATKPPTTFAWKKTLILVLANELRAVLDRFSQLAHTDPELMDSVRLDLKMSCQQLTAMIAALAANKEK